MEAIHGHGGATRIVWLDEALELDEPCPCNFCEDGDHAACIFIGPDNECGCGEPT